MTKVQNFLCGIYSQIGLNLKKDNSNIHLVVRNRNKPTAKKPKKFLIRLADKKAIYISSLYPNKDNSYNLEYQNAHYKLNQISTSDGMKVFINQIAPNQYD
jgi:hypothetical protein